MSLESQEFYNNYICSIATLRELTAAIAHITGDLSGEFTDDQRCISANAVAVLARCEADKVVKRLEQDGLTALIAGRANV